MNTMETQEVTPVISVCVPAYNAARYIGECIESVLAQTFPYFELLIVDNGSKDRICEWTASSGNLERKSRRGRRFAPTRSMRHPARNMRFCSV